MITGILLIIIDSILDEWLIKIKELFKSSLGGGLMPAFYNYCLYNNDLTVVVTIIYMLNECDLSKSRQELCRFKWSENIIYTHFFFQETNSHKILAQYSFYRAFISFKSFFVYLHWQCNLIDTLCEKSFQRSLASISCPVLVI